MSSGGGNAGGGTGLIIREPGVTKVAVPHLPPQWADGPCPVPSSATIRDRCSGSPTSPVRLLSVRVARQAVAATEGCIRREGTSEAAPEAVR